MLKKLQYLFMIGARHAVGTQQAERPLHLEGRSSQNCPFWKRKPGSRVAVKTKQGLGPVLHRKETVSL